MESGKVSLHYDSPHRTALFWIQSSSLDPFDGKVNRTNDIVCGTDWIRNTFSQNFLVSDIVDYWMKDAEAFKELSKKYYLYE